MLLIAGSGRSGTSTLAGITRLLGLQVPGPEVAADESNPMGFGEPQWVVDQHNRWLRSAGVQVADARPQAWVKTAAIADREGPRVRLATQLAPYLGKGDLVVKDPRLGWFLALWRRAIAESDATPVFATMLRPPAEVVGSKQHYYGSRRSSTQLVASWLNMMLHTERATRPVAEDGGRVFVRYDDLLTSWRDVVLPMGRSLCLSAVVEAGSDRMAEVDRFVDPTLRRFGGSLDDLALPGRLHDLAVTTWESLDRLADPEGDTAATRATLDEVREAYVELYLESEAIAQSSIVAAKAAARHPGPRPARTRRDRWSSAGLRAWRRLRARPR